MSPRIFTVAVGVAMIIVGIVVLALGTSATNPNGWGQLDCGSAFNPNIDELTTEATVDGLSDAMLGLPEDAEPMAGVQACEAALTTRHMFGWPVGGLGIVMLVGAVFVRTKNSPPLSMPKWLSRAAQRATPPQGPTRLAGPSAEENAAQPSSTPGGSTPTP